MELPGTVPYLDWRWDDLIFLALAGVMLGSALLVVLGRDIIRSALWLILSFAALAGIYGLLGSAFLAISQVLTYVGAIAVLVLFAVMITQSKRGPARLVFNRQWWAGALAAVVLVALMIISVMLTEWDATEVVQVAEAREVALTVYGEYMFAFIVLGVLLLAGVIGGLYLAKRDDDMPQTNQHLSGTPDEEESA
ncbi:MAG: NADH-quinone oxidoreductase subunit J [Candidatus Limnocylindrales bacterium]